MAKRKYDPETETEEHRQKRLEHNRKAKMRLDANPSLRMALNKKIKQNRNANIEEARKKDRHYYHVLSPEKKASKIEKIMHRILNYVVRL